MGGMNAFAWPADMWLPQLELDLVVEQPLAEPEPMQLALPFPKRMSRATQRRLERDEIIRNLWLKGMGLKEIWQATDIPYGTISNTLHRFRREGARHEPASPERDRRIAAYLYYGMSRKDAQAAFGLTRAEIDMIVANNPIE